MSESFFLIQTIVILHALHTKLNLAHDNDETVDSLLQFVQTNIHKDARIVTKQAKTVHINLPRDVSIQDIFTTLYSDKAAEGKSKLIRYACDIYASNIF